MSAGRLTHPVLEKVGEGTEEMEPRNLEGSKEGLPCIAGNQSREEPSLPPLSPPTQTPLDKAYHCPNPTRSRGLRAALLAADSGVNVWGSGAEASARQTPAYLPTVLRLICPALSFSSSFPLSSSSSSLLFFFFLVLGLESRTLSKPCKRFNLAPHTLKMPC